MHMLCEGAVLAKTSRGNGCLFHDLFQIVFDVRCEILRVAKARLGEIFDGEQAGFEAHVAPAGHAMAPMPVANVIASVTAGGRRPPPPSIEACMDPVSY